MKKFLLAIFMGFMLISTINAQEGKDKDFKPSGKVFGELFNDYYYMLKGDMLENGSGQFKKNKKGDNGFNIRRFYLGYKYDFSEKFSAKLMFEGNDANLLTNGKRSVNIKYAYFKWKNIFKGSDLIVGAQSTPTWSRFTEKIWGYRSVEKTILDYWKQGISNDLGISLTGKLNQSGTVHYNLMIGNGSAQKPESNIYKKFYGSVNAKLFNKKLLLEMYGDYQPQALSENKYTIKGFIGFQNENITVGLEPFIIGQNKANDENVKINGTTIFVRGKLINDGLNGFARLDLFKNAKDVDKYLKFSVIGLDFQPTENVHIMPNIWFNTYSFLNNNVTEDGSDVVGRVTFWFKF